MAFGRVWFLMCVVMFLHSLPCISTVNFPIKNIKNPDCSGFDNNLGRHLVASPQHAPISWTPKLSKLVLSFGRGNDMVNGVILVITLLNIIVYKLRQLYKTSLGEDKKPPSPSLSSGHLCRQFSLAEMRLATNDFDEELVTGKGGFGKVYRGVIDNGATMVAIKRLDARSKQGESEFWTEIKMLSKFRHSHLVSLFGYCDEFDEMMLVYEYVSGGNLAEHLHKIDGSTNKSPLSWVKRLKICVGAARALDYLHTGTGVQHCIIHRDVKSSNILLDELVEAKVSDLGVSKIGPVDQPCTHVSTDVKGSFGYFDPNYFLTRRLTRKSDVYSYGVVLLEVLCGRPAVDPSLEDNELGLVGWAQRCIREGKSNNIIDTSLTGQILPDCLKAFVEIVEKCLKTRPKERPTMAEVVVRLEAALAQQERANYFVANKEMGSCSPFDNHERANYYTKSGKLLTFSRMLQQMLAVKSPVRPDVKPPEKKKRKSNCFFSSTLSTQDLLHSKSGDTFQEVAAPSSKIFTLDVLKSATRNFSHDMVVGEGAFGKVFIGWVEQETYVPTKVGSGMAVAIKKLGTDSYQGLEEWQAEVEILGRLSHPNIVSLLGYCSEDKELLLVYELMQKGSLENYMLKKGYGQLLPWSMRLKILIGAARGITYLHSSDNQIIFRDLKSSNILLDQDFNAKLADFGLAKHGPIDDDAHLSTQVMGTYGYAAPEYVATGNLNGKNDIYAFGVVLLETLTGLRVFDKTRPQNKQNLVEWAIPLLPIKKKIKTIVDPSLGHDYSLEAAFQCAKLVLKCIEPDTKERPSIGQVLQMLERISGIKRKLFKGRG